MTSMGSTISAAVNAEVMLGSGVFLSPLTITTTGRITGPAETSSFQSASAIYVAAGISGASILNHGQISGVLPQFDSLSIPAILAESALNLNNYGTIIGQSGVYLDAGGTVTNAGLIAGSDARSAHDYGVRLVNGSLINSGTVYGAKYGVTNINRSGIANSGTIQGSLAGVDLISTTLAYGGTLVNQGSIYGHISGITASQALITNSGNVDGATYGIHIAWGSTISNSGNITGGLEGVMLLNEQYQSSEDSTLQNSGRIAGGYFGAAINFSSVTNAVTGTISGQTFGAGVGEASNLLNAGLVYGVNGGLLLENGGLAVNSASVRGGAVGGWLFSGGQLTNTSAGTISGATGVRDLSGYLLNAGTVRGTGFGLNLTGGGIAVSSGAVSATGVGIYLSSISSTTSPDFVINSGGVYGGSVGGMIDNGTVYNYGTIQGGVIGASLVTGTSLVNSGDISGPKYGVQLAGGTVANTGTIAGNTLGVEINHGYLFNSGTISGGTYAVSGQGFTLGLGAGAVFGGEVADKTDTSTLDLTGAAFGSIAGIGSTISGFEDINFVAGSHWLLLGNTIGLTNHQTINGFAQGDTIILTGFTATGALYYSTGLALFYNHANVDIVMDITGPITGTILVTEAAIGTTITVACFVSGTRILTPDGEIAVQELGLGDTVITFSGEDRPIIWIGKRVIDLRDHPAPQAVQPVCITANALADNVPMRDLWVSPDHAIYIDGYLVPAKALLNGSTIFQASRQRVSYYHIELAEHGVIFAENAAVETYLESGNRAGFENGGDAIIANHEAGESIRRRLSCAMLIESGDELNRIRAMILQRSEAVIA